MADLDTRSKRASSVQMLVPSLVSLVLPDGTIGHGDRQHSIWSYSGILAGAQAVAVALTIDFLYGTDAGLKILKGSDRTLRTLEGSDLGLKTL